MRPEPATTDHIRNLIVIRHILSFRVLLGLGLVLVYLLTIRNRFNDPDLWFHLKLGEVIWNTSSIPSTETFSHTAAGHSWTAHEWLGQLSLFAAYQTAGNMGLMVWFAISGSLLFLLVYALCYLTAPNALAAFLGGLSAWFFGTIGLAIRPHMLGYTFLAAELLTLRLSERDRRWLWTLPILFALWVNVHGSYMFGIGLLAAYWFCTFQMPRCTTSIRELGLILGLSGAALCLNPVGPRLLLYPLNVAFQQPTNLAAVDEWQPPSMADGRTVAMLAALLALSVAGLRKREEWQVRDILIIGMAAVMASRHARMLFVFGIVASPYLTRLFAAVLGKDDTREQPVANAVLIGAMALAAARLFPGNGSLDAQVRQRSPVGAAAYVRHAQVSGPMLNDYAFGGYLMWALGEHKVFVDGRADVFDWTGVLKEFGRWATLAEDPNLLLNKYRIRFCVLSTKSPLTHVLPYLPGWQLAYEDDVAAVFVRQQAPGDSEVARVSTR